MFSSKHHGDATHADLSIELREIQDWQVGTLLLRGHCLDVTAVAVDAVSNTVAIGTAEGELHILGGPGVEKHWALPEPRRIKLLQYAASVLKLLCLDDQDRMYVWDISRQDQPKLQASTRLGAPANWLTVSPSHTHAFVALGSGEVKTYDLLCLRASPYTIPNLLSLYEKEASRESEGWPSTTEPSRSVPLEVVVHPRNLDLLFIAYSDGVVLSDLEQRRTVGVYRLILPPGAPGGAGHTGPDLLKMRRPSVTAIAVHPSGHFFAAGHADGCMSFWAVDDTDSPLLVRTLDAADVNLPNMDLFNEERTTSSPPDSEREPVFKLAWSGFPNSSDPRGGETALFILGGQTSRDPPGTYVLWLPAFNPGEPPATPGSRALHPVFRKAMCDSLVPIDAAFYSTSGLTQDFYLIPRDSPHFNGSWDPVAILLLSEGEGKTCALEAYSVSAPYSIPAALPNPKPDLPAADGQSNLVDELAATLESLKADDGGPRRLNLPPHLWSGTTAVTSTTLHIMDRDPYERLVDGAAVDEDGFPVSGGSAWIDEEAAGNELKFAKYQPHRIIISQHRDGTVRFQDISAQIRLKTESAPLERNIPSPLPALTIDPLFALSDPSLLTHFPPEFSAQVKVRSVVLAPESLECYIILRLGEVLVYRFGPGNSDIQAPPMTLPDAELVSLRHISAPLQQKFHPYLLVAAKKGPVVACAPSDIGFFAVSYISGLLLIVDLRGPKIIYRSDKDPSTKRKSAFHRHSQELESFTTLTWTVCRMASDPMPRVRLLAIPASGRTRVFSLNRASSGSWAVDFMPNPPEAPSEPIFSAFIDAYSGARFKADRYGLSRALDPSTEDAIAGKGHSYWIVAGAKGIRCSFDLDGHKIGKADWGSKIGKVECCEIVERNGSQAFVAFTDGHEALIYTLPALEHLHTLQLPQQSNLPVSPDASGDFLHHATHPSAASLISRTTYATLFDIRRAYYHIKPEVDVLTRSDTGKRGVIPPQPQPVSMGPPSIKDVVGGWLGAIGAGLGGKPVMTGEQIDALLAGPNRPLPKPAPAPAPKSPPSTDRASVRTSNTMSSRRSRGTSRSPSPDASQEGSSTTGLYDRLTSAISERGEALGDLEEQFKSLEEGSKGMIAQAKRLATQQTAKSWFGL